MTTEKNTPKNTMKNTKENTKKKSPKSASSLDESLSELSFEDGISSLEKLVSKMETSDLSLEESIAGFERGVELYKVCRQKLENAQGKISILSESLELVDLQKDEKNSDKL